MAFACAGLLLAGHAAAAGARAYGQWRTVTVRAGESLWALSRRYGPPDEDPRQWIFEVSQVNHLTGAPILAGQSLRLPAAR